MKLIRLTAFLALLLCLQSLLVIGQGVDVRQCGDCNNDGRIDPLDYTLMMGTTLGQPDFAYCNVAGVLGSIHQPQTTIDLADQTKMKEFLNGVIPTLDCSEKKEIVYTEADFVTLTADIDKVQVDGDYVEDITPAGLSPFDTYLSPTFFGEYPHRKVLFIYWKPHPVGGYLTDAIGMMNANGSNFTHVYTPQNPSFISGIDASDDGSSILFGQYDQINGTGYQVYTFIPSTGNLTHLHIGLDPQYNPKNKEIVFRTNGPRYIYKMKANGGGVTLLTSAGINNIKPKWSLDGGSITFQRTNSPSMPYISDVYTIGADGRNELLITPTGGAMAEAGPIYTSKNQLLYFNALLGPALFLNQFHTVPLANPGSQPSAFFVNPSAGIKENPSLG